MRGDVIWTQVFENCKDMQSRQGKPLGSTRQKRQEEHLLFGRSFHEENA